MLDKLYEAGIHPSLWAIVKDMYTGLTAKVKWIGELSESFKIQQGVSRRYFIPVFIQNLHKPLPGGT